MRRLYGLAVVPSLAVVLDSFSAEDHRPIDQPAIVSSRSHASGTAETVDDNRSTMVRVYRSSRWRWRSRS
jgi:hypothetical protein